ncbi:MAG: 4-hydroxythreonine-4-phosphate dehydrogenase PdxA [bacterium]
MKKTPVIGLTIGDPAGIGPEIIEKALAHFSKRADAPALRIIGSAKGARAGKPNKTSARQALAALESSVELLQRGEICAVVNGPVCKKNLSLIGFPFPGQTEFYAARAGCAPSQVTMMLTSPRLTVSLVTTHCALRKAIRALTAKSIVETTQRTIAALLLMGIRNPKIAVCGLNPHAGEEGLFGDEEQRVILPAVAALQKEKRARISGPHAPDTVFLQASRGVFDAVICMYHDQGLIPLKLIGFDSGVNLTLGLPFWRAAPDHGTAFDIAGKNIASPASLIAAIRLVNRLTRRRI